MTIQQQMIERCADGNNGNKTTAALNIYFASSISAGTNSINLSVDRKKGCQTESSRKLFGNKRSEKTHTHL